MKRRPLTHAAVFADAASAARYAREQQRVFRWMHPALLELLKSSGFAGGRILDAGCGPGFHAVGLARAFPGSSVLGVDLSVPLLETARSHLAASGIPAGVTFERGDVLQLPYSDCSFDAVVSVFMFHLMDDPAAMCNEMARMLRPDGHVVIIDLRRNFFLSLFEREMRSAYLLEEALQIIKATNLRVAATRQTPIWWGACG